MSVDDAERILVRTRTFEFGGMPPKRQVEAFNLLLDQPDARARFESIATHAETAGKLYALCAFLAIGSPMTTSLASDLASSRATLVVQDSDIVLGRKAASEVVALIQSRRLWEEMRSAKEETARYVEKGG